MGDVSEIDDRLYISIDKDDYLEDCIEKSPRVEEDKDQFDKGDIDESVLKNEFEEVEEISKEEINTSNEETDSVNDRIDESKVEANCSKEKFVERQIPKEKKTGKRSRGWKTIEQRMYLVYFYNNESQYPSRKEKSQLSKDLQISPKQVTTWFHNRRAADRKKAKEEESMVTMVRIARWENLYGMGPKRGRRKSSD